MQFVPTTIPDVISIHPNVFGDARGYFFESWNQYTFTSAHVDLDFVQDNHSHSTQYILRGLHYQIQQPQGKLVRVTSGEVFDVAVDIRHHSPTFGHWVGVILSGENHDMLYVPPGFAHGYLVLSDSADFLYKVTDFWAPEYERCIRWDDPTININWPLPPGIQPILSSKDATAPLFELAEVYS
jgi:dTDP-4-dehydrorhamnose 3,5-epimerase